MRLIVIGQIVACLILALASGCAQNGIDVSYGRRRGNPGAESVNGTSVLAGMFEKAGHRVTTWSRLSPKLQDSKTIVWFPDDFVPPTVEQRAFLERWLDGAPGRTLVYVGRDYNAAIEYWKRILPSVPAEQVVEVSRRHALAQAIHDRGRAKIPEAESCDWFVTHRDGTRRIAKPLTGVWAAGVDSTKSSIEIEGRFEIPTQPDIDKWVARATVHFGGPPRYERLLASESDTIAARISWDDKDKSQIIFVANGSFLLNLPLVNPEHRKLAGKLIAACGPAGRTVFLESGKGGPQIFDKEPGANAATGFEVFTVWPIGIILLHLTAMGFLACISLFPIFGRPREWNTTSSTDFGQHINALGELLQQVGDREYALQRVRAYHEIAKRETGSSAPS